MRKFSIGMDFGSLSARAIVMDAASGKIAASEQAEYRHGVLTEALPDGTPLTPGWCAQVPADYIEAMKTAVRAAVKAADAKPEQIAGIGIDATTSTVLCTTAEAVPMCELERYRSEPNAYIKLWKHHAAQAQADRLGRLAIESGADWLSQFGGYVSAEDYYPKAAQLADEAPELYDAAGRIIEVCDWLVWKLCGMETKNYCAAAFKTYYRPGKGGIERKFLAKLNPRLESLPEKNSGKILYPGDMAGRLTAEGAELLGLKPGIPVAAGTIDAHVTTLGCGTVRPGDMLMVVGTSCCHMVASDIYREVKGINGAVYEGVYPGMYIYEGGQACVGDMFSWFVKNCVPASYLEEAKTCGRDIYSILGEKAAGTAPGGSGLVALDWWNGVRATLMDFELSGLLVGLSMDTRPEDIYLALMEAAAYGARHIRETFTASGVGIKRVFAAGGIPRKNKLLMQIYADVLDTEINVVEEEQTGARGSALLGLAAAGNGFKSLPDIISALGEPPCTVYTPEPERADRYNELYHFYEKLCQDFAGSREIMHRLRAMRGR